MTVEIPQGYTGETQKVKVECDRILSIVIELKPYKTENKMKGKCNKCAHVYNITCSPNKIEGYFVTQDVWDARQSEMLNDVIKEDGNKPIYCQKCPKCGHIAVV